MDAIRPKSINYENVREGGNEEVILLFATYFVPQNGKAIISQQVFVYQTKVLMHFLLF